MKPERSSIILAITRAPINARQSRVQGAEIEQDKWKSETAAQPQGGGVIRPPRKGTEGVKESVQGVVELLASSTFSFPATVRQSLKIREVLHAQ